MASSPSGPYKKSQVHFAKLVFCSVNTLAELARISLALCQVPIPVEHLRISHCSKILKEDEAYILLSLANDDSLP
jgi:hypothetical protein